MFVSYVRAFAQRDLGRNVKNRKEPLPLYTYVEAVLPVSLPLALAWKVS